MNFQDILVAKRDGQKHTKPELEFLVKAAAKGDVPDYQLSAWLMAAYLNPLDAEETAWLTVAMAESGEQLDLEGLPHPWVDKHSTGGVGDKTSIVLLPLLAACGLSVVKMSGRGLGITGGTVDKLASVPGFRMDLSPEEMKDQAKRIGLAITGQTPNLAPADKVLYALRDATATVSSIPLIVSSILSKKMAGGAETIVLDVKAGSGAFMKSVEAARELAGALGETARLAGLKARLAITDMSQPLGRTVGNALEVMEAAAVLTGNEPSRFCELCLRLAALTLVAAEVTWDLESGYDRARGALVDGSALLKAESWFEAQGADPTVLVRPDLLPQAAYRHRIEAPNEGFVSEINAEAVGHAAVLIGAGRVTKEDLIDPSAGIEVHVEVGSQIQKGQPVFTIHARDESSALAVSDSLTHAIRVSETRVDFIDPVIEILNPPDARS